MTRMIRGELNLGGSLPGESPNPDKVQGGGPDGGADGREEDFGMGRTRA